MLLTKRVTVLAGVGDTVCEVKAVAGPELILVCRVVSLVAVVWVELVRDPWCVVLVGSVNREDSVVGVDGEWRRLLVVARDEPQGIFSQHRTRSW